MAQLLGKPKAPPKTEKRTVSDKDKAVLKLKRARDKLTKFQKKVCLHIYLPKWMCKDLLSVLFSLSTDRYWCSEITNSCKGSDSERPKGSCPDCFKNKEIKTAGSGLSGLQIDECCTNGMYILLYCIAMNCC